LFFWPITLRHKPVGCRNFERT